MPLHLKFYKEHCNPLFLCILSFVSSPRSSLPLVRSISSKYITMIDIKCNCGATAVIRTSYSKRIPGKLYYACTVKGPLCKFIGWVNDYDQDCDCMAFRMKLEEQNRKLKLYLVISWLVFKFNENVVFATYAIYHSILASNITIKKDKNSKISKITIDH
uniref:Zinc finger GRF-type domain-containing protein n=1 Tax=Lactuca sativa TaxID=4236 RepID=A0A9R1X755_LACSA|nr:hypothetical protein LSAT_V11C600330320 [Lactuca sativa]